MKIAVAAMSTNVAEHFGHCEHFLIFNVENGQVSPAVALANPGHRPGFLPNYLADNGAEVIIAGGMGGGAVDIVNERGVEVILGARGDARAAAEAYVRGALKSTGSICHEHQHADECGQH